MAKDLSDAHASTDFGRPDFAALATAVLSVLSEKGGHGAGAIRSSVVGKLIAASLECGNFDAEGLLEDLRGRRINPDQIVDIYIPRAARELGHMWCDDRIGFAKVTIATARLQSLLTQLAQPWPATPSETATGANLLLLLQGNDNHTLGPHVVTAQLRRIGSSVRILFSASGDTVLRALSGDTYDMVLFSGSRPDSLASIANLVKRIRTGIATPPPMVLGGNVLTLSDCVKEQTDVDLVTNDVKVALKLCERRKSGQGSLAR